MQALSPRGAPHALSTLPRSLEHLHSVPWAAGALELPVLFGAPAPIVAAACVPPPMTLPAATHNLHACAAVGAHPLPTLLLDLELLVHTHDVHACARVRCGAHHVLSLLGLFRLGAVSRWHAPRARRALAAVNAALSRCLQVRLLVRLSAHSNACLACM
jgi:hypothetical protein